MTLLWHCSEELLIITFGISNWYPNHPHDPIGRQSGQGALMKLIPNSLPLHPVICPWVSENAVKYASKFMVTCIAAAMKFGI